LIKAIKLNIEVDRGRRRFFERDK